MISCRCRECGEEYRLDDSHAGRRFRCRECGEPVEVGGGRSRSYDDDDDMEPVDRGPLVMGLVIGGGVLAALLVIGFFTLGDRDDDEIAANDPAPNAVPARPARRPAFNPAPRPVTNPQPRPPANQPTTVRRPGNAAPAMQPGGVGLGGNPGANNGNLGGRVDWTAAIDPPPAEHALEPDAEIEVKLPFPGRGFPTDRDVLYPRLGSPYLAIGQNNSVRDQRVIYDLRNGKRVGMVANVDNAQKPALSPDGRLFVFHSFVGTRPKGLYLIDAEEGKLLGTIPRERTPTVVKIAGERLVAIESRELTVWKLPEGNPLYSADLASSPGREHVAFSPGGRYMAYAATSGRTGIHLVDLETGEPAGWIELSGRSMRITALEFSPDGEELAALAEVSFDHMLRAWSMADGSSTASFEIERPPHNHGSPVLQWFPNRQAWFLSGSAIVDRNVKKLVWAVPRTATSRNPRLVLTNTTVAAVARQGLDAVMLGATVPREQIAQAAKTVAAGGKRSDAGLPPLTKADWTGVEVAAFPEGPITLEPDPIRAEQPDKVKTPISLGSHSSLTVKMAAPGFAIASRHEKTPTPRMVFEVIELAKGKKTGSVDVGHVCTYGALSPSGSKLLVRANLEGDRLDVFDVDTGDHVLGWRPTGEDDNRRVSTSIREVHFLDDDHVLTLAASEVVVWELPACRAVYRLPDVQQLLLTPGRRYLGLQKGKTIGFVEALTGRSAGLMTTTRMVRHLDVHPDGRRLGAFVWDRGQTSFALWDLPTGKLELDFPVRRAGDIRWCGDRFVLTGLGALLDLELQMAVWRYQSLGRDIIGDLAGRAWHVERVSSQHWLVGTVLPEPVIASRLHGIDPLDQFALKPGMSVKLVLNLLAPPGDPQFVDRVREDVRKRLIAHGITVRNDAALTLELSANRSSDGSEQYTLRPFFGSTNRREETVTVQGEHIRTVIALKSGGQVLWDTDGIASNSISHGFIRDDETVQGNLTNKMWRSYKGFLSSPQVPQYVFGPRAGYGFGVSRLTIRGAEPTNLSPVPGELRR